MEKWSPKDAVKYLEELQVIQEDEVKYHCLFIKLASLLVGQEEATKQGYALDFATLEQFKQLNKDSYKALKNSRLTCGQQLKHVGIPVAGSWAINVPFHMMAETHDLHFRKGQGRA